MAGLNHSDPPGDVGQSSQAGNPTSDSSGSDGSNIVLIGFPGSGKSTVGRALAEATGRRFVDSDEFIQAGQDRSLQDILDNDGIEAFCRIEESYIVCLEVRGYVIATGGSVVYSPAAMRYLRNSGPVVWLAVDFPTLRDRLADIHGRGVVLPKGTSLEDLYAERRPMYERWADIRVDTTGMGLDETVAAVREALGE